MRLKINFGTGTTWLLPKWPRRFGYLKMKKIQLGSFSNKIAAARVYNQAALIYHGEFARLNVI